jgi:uncharacterized membrane protein (UPF0127 family)
MNIEIGGVTVEAEVASTPEELYRGLSEKDSLDDREGMFFDWPMEQQHGLVMRDMSFPIDTVFFNQTGEVVHTATLRRDGSQATAHSKYALELPEGFCDKHNVNVGDTASFEVETHNVSKKDEQDEEWTYEEGPRGADRWVNERGDVRYRPPSQEEDESELGYDLAESEVGNIGATVKPGEYRRDLQSPDEAMEALSEFEAIEEEYPYDEWEFPDAEDWTEGSYVRVQDGIFQGQGDGDEGQLGIIIQSEDPPVLMTEEGELKRIDQSDMNNTGEGDTALVLATWNDPANKVATGQKEWSNFVDEAVPDNVPEQEDEEEEPDEDTAPSWVSEDPLSEITESPAPRTGVEEGELYFIDGEITELTPNEERSGDIQSYNTADTEYAVNYSEIDDVLCRANRATDVSTGEIQYIDFKEDSEYEDGWYDVQDEFIETVEGDPNSIGYRMWSEEAGEVEISSTDMREEADGVHKPIENSYAPSIESTPEPSGEKDPDTWSIDWTSQAEDKIGDALPMAQKKLLIQEWEEAIDNPEATDSVSKTIRDVKDSTFNTQGQKYDKLIQALMDAEGEPRSNGFEDADDPTEDEVEAMRLLQEASQKYFEENFGENTAIHRALANYSHERLLPQIKDTIVSDEKLADKEIELEDNPAGVWTTEEGAANTFTSIGGTSKSLVIEDSASKEDVFNMPDAIYPYEQRQEINSVDSDWDEAEINVPSNGKRLQPSQISVVQAFEFGEERDIAPLADVIDDPQSVVESGNPGAIASFLRTLEGLGDEELYTAYKETIESNDAITESDGWEVIEGQIQSLEYEPGESVFASQSMKQDTDLVTIDLTSEADSNWLHTDEGGNEGDESDSKQKLLSAAVSALESNMTGGQAPDSEWYFIERQDNGIHGTFAKDRTIVESPHQDLPPFSKEQAEYLTPEDPDFDVSHSRCEDCVFYAEGGQCAVVDGNVDPEHYCEQLYSEVLFTGHEHGDEGVIEELVIIGPDVSWREEAVEDYLSGIREIIESKGIGKSVEVNETNVHKFEAAIKMNEDPNDLQKQKLLRDAVSALSEEVSKDGRLEKPFAEYDSFSDCVSQNSDKRDPEAYCAQIEYEATGSWPGEKMRKEVADKYLEGTGLSEDDFVPNSDVNDVVEEVLEFIDEHGMPNPEDQREGSARANQLKDHYDNDESLAYDFWEEIYNFHKRHRAQNNHQCDEDSIPESDKESINQNEFDVCLFDNGYFSDYTWGSDAAYEQAEKIVTAVEDAEVETGN